LEEDFDSYEEMLSIAAMCEVEYPFYPLHYRSHQGNHNLDEKQRKIQNDINTFVVLGSDHLTLLNIYQQFIENQATQSWCDSFSIQYKVMQKAKEIRHNLSTIMKRYHSSNFVFSKTNEETQLISTNFPLEKRIRRCLVTGYFANVAKLATDGKYRTLRGAMRVEPLAQTSVVARYGTPPEWVIFHECMTTTTSRQQQQQQSQQSLTMQNTAVDEVASMREVTRIEPLWLSELAPHYYDLKF
jgi:ATP-dependent RNA helicase DDX35